MSDVPADRSGSEEEIGGYVPSGLRRSTYTPPPAGAPLPTFDDDALAEAMAAEVRTYTGVISLPEQPQPVVADASPGAPSLLSPAESSPPQPWGIAPFVPLIPAAPADAGRPPIPAPSPPAPSPPVPPAPEPVDFTPSPEPVIVPEVSDEPASPNPDEGLLRSLGAGSTLEAIEHLERELRRRGLTGEQPTVDVPVSGEEPEVVDEGAPAEEPVALTWLAAPPPAYTPPPLVEPPVPGAIIDPPPEASDEAFLTSLSRPIELPEVPQNAEQSPPAGHADDGTATPTEVDPLASFVPPAPLESVAPIALPSWDALIAEPDSPTNGADEPSLDRDDDVDYVDYVFGAGAIPVSSAGAVGSVAPPSAPIPTLRLSEAQPALVDELPQQHPVFAIETAGAEPTALDLRAGRAARLFWLWFAANSSVISLALGAVLFGLGMSLRQAIVATLAGVAISFLPLGLGTLAGKWSGQPTMVVSRAMFGHGGNVLPALLAIVVRVFWGGVLLWLLAFSVADVLVGAGLDAGLGKTVWSLVGLVVGFVIATLVAFFGYGLLARVQLVLSIVSAVLIVGAAVLTFRSLDFAVALSAPDGPWILVVSGAVLVFSVIGLAWVHASSDVARYQRPGSYGGSSMLWATFGATLPPFLLIAWGAMLAASRPKLASGLTTDPLATIAGLLPGWYPVPLLFAAGLGLLSGAVLTIYSGGFALQSIAERLQRRFAVLIAALLVLIAGIVLVFVVHSTQTVVRDLAATLAVPVAAWAGIFAAEMMIRNRPFHEPSLLHRGGIYPNVRWINLIGLIVISAIGFGLTSSTAAGLSWQGYLFRALGLSAEEPLAMSDVGVLVALVLGILLPLVSAVPAVRRQESLGAGT